MGQPRNWTKTRVRLHRTTFWFTKVDRVTNAADDGSVPQIAMGGPSQPTFPTPYPLPSTVASH